MTEFLAMLGVVYGVIVIVRLEFLRDRVAKLEKIHGWELLDEEPSS